MTTRRRSCPSCFRPCTATRRPTGTSKKGTGCRQPRASVNPQSARPSDQLGPEPEPEIAARKQGVISLWTVLSTVRGVSAAGSPHPKPRSGPAPGSFVRTQRPWQRLPDILLRSLQSRRRSRGPAPRQHSGCLFSGARSPAVAHPGETESRPAVLAAYRAGDVNSRRSLTRLPRPP